MDTRLPNMFYHSVLSVIFLATAYWGSSVGSGGAKKLNKLVRKASSVVGMELDSV